MASSQALQLREDQAAFQRAHGPGALGASRFLRLLPLQPRDTSILLGHLARVLAVCFSEQASVRFSVHSKEGHWGRGLAASVPEKLSILGT